MNVSWNTSGNEQHQKTAEQVKSSKFIKELLKITSVTTV